MKYEKLGATQVTTSAAAKRQIEIWINVLNLLTESLPIPDILQLPSLGVNIISTDAAGNQDVNLEKRIGAGVAWKRFDKISNKTVTIVA